MLIRYWNSDKYKVSFLGIPKCGSSSVRAALGCHPENDWSLDPKYEKTITFLRDPVERFVSMFGEMHRQRHTDKAATFEMFVASIKRHGFWNEHLLPQSRYYRPCYEVYILNDHKGFEDKYEQLPHINITAQRVKVNLGVKSLIKEWYNRDYLLINQLK